MPLAVGSVGSPHATGARPTSLLPPVNLWPGRVVKCGEGQQCENFFIDRASPGPAC